MAEQLGVDREHDQPGAFPLRGEALQSSRDRGDELAPLLAGALGRRGRLVGIAADRPRARSPQRLAVEVGVQGVRRIAVEGPQPPDRLPVDRVGDGLARGRDRRQRRQRLVGRALIGAEVAQAALGEQPLEAGLVGALGQPEPVRLAEAPAMRAQPGVDLQAAALAGGDEREHGVGRGRREELDPSRSGRIREQAQQVAVEGLQPRERGAVTVGLGPARVAVGRLDVVHVGVARADPVRAQELQQPLGNAGGLELIGEHRGDGERDAVGDRADRHVGADHRVEQPLLAERIGAVALHVGHVAVKDERQVPDPAVGGHRRQTARKSRARSRSHSAAGLTAKSAAEIAGTKRS